MQRIDKKASRQRWRELRDIWNDYDPIGVINGSGWPLDEYESYVGPTMRLLEQNAEIGELVDLLQQCSDRMGLNFNKARAFEFSTKFKNWYSTNWHGSRV